MPSKDSYPMAKLNSQLPVKLDTSAKNLLDRYSFGDLCEYKLSTFLEKLGGFYPENVYDEVISVVDRALIVKVLQLHDGNQVQTARALGINRNTLRARIKKYGIKDHSIGGRRGEVARV